LPRHFLDGGVGCAAATDDDDGSCALRAVESNRHVQIVHRESDRSAILDELCVDDPRKCPRQIHVAAGQRQNGLLGRNPPYERRELEVQASYGTSKFIDVGETKYLRR
jgi:hypothetical protein